MYVGFCGGILHPAVGAYISLPKFIYLLVVFIFCLIGMWNQIFLGSYMSLFVAIPFAYFFTESEGFAGSRKVQ